MAPFTFNAFILRLYDMLDPKEHNIIRYMEYNLEYSGDRNVILYSYFWFAGYAKAMRAVKLINDTECKSIIRDLRQKTKALT